MRFSLQTSQVYRSRGNPPGRDWLPVSSWLAEAASSKLRSEALAEFLTGWQADHGVLTADEIARAEHELGLTSADSAA